MEGSDIRERERVLVRATVNLQGLPVGATASVDPGDPYVAELLEATFLVPVAVPSDSHEAAAGGAADEAQGDEHPGG